MPDVGVKAQGLLQLCKSSNVPKWVAVPSSILESLMCQAGIDGEIRAKLKQLRPENIGGTSSALQELICSVSFPEVFQKELATHLAEISDDEAYVSVRSSSGDEDGVNHTFAGLHESFLFVKGVDSVCEHILKVWASVYGERALRYRCENNLPLYPVSLAVIVQRMVKAKTSGKILTADVDKQDHSKVIVSAVYGVGAGLGRSGVEADKYFFNKSDRKLNTVVGVKSSRLAINSKKGCGVHEIPVEESIKVLPALSSVQVEKLVDKALELELYYGRPQEIEFCFDDNGVVYILQTRGITALKEYGPAAGNYQLWDNSAIVDSYAGITSPMTFSFFCAACAAGSKAFCKLTGMKKRRIADNENLCRNIPGFFDGRIYIGVSNLLRLVKQIPGYYCCRNIIESLAGLTGSNCGNVDAQKNNGSCFKRLVDMLRVLLLAGSMTFRFMTLWMRIPAFSRRVDRFIEKWDLSNFNGLQPHELMRIYDRLEKKVLRKWETPVINALYVRVFSGSLGHCCRKWCDDKETALPARLLCGVSNSYAGSTGVLMKLARRIKGVDAVKYIFQTCTVEELSQIVPVYPECSAIHQDIEDYLSVYGLRCANELKLEEPSLREMPEYLYQVLKNYIDMNDSRLDVNAIILREKIIRDEAEQLVLKKLSGVRRKIMHFVLNHARKGIVYSDGIRYSRVKISAFVRRLLNAAGDKLAREKIIESDQDIYYLTIDEVRGYISGRAVTTDLRSLISIRHKQFDKYYSQSAEISNCFLTYGMAYNRNTFLDCNPPAGSEAEEISVEIPRLSDGDVSGQINAAKKMNAKMQWERDVRVAAQSDSEWTLLSPSVRHVG